MNKQNITKFLQSFVAIPLFAATMPFAGVSTPVTTVVAQNNGVIEASLITPEEAEIDAKNAKAIDDFLTKRKSVLAGYGKKFVAEARKNDIDPFLLVAISGRETTFYRPESQCKSERGANNPFGYGSCRISFDSIDEAIEKVTASIAGKNPKTAHHYEGKTTYQILRKYNTVIKRYPEEVIAIMKMISPDDSNYLAMK